MKKTLITALLLACALPLRAQTTDAKAQPGGSGAAKTETHHKKAAKKHAKAAARPQPAAAPDAQPQKDAKPAAQQPDPDQDESGGVMIDSKSDVEDTGRFSAGQRGDQEEPSAGTGGIPSSYGQCKGVVNEAGRTLLVFESPDDGAITFVQVTPGKNSVSWRLVDRIPRSAD